MNATDTKTHISIRFSFRVPQFRKEKLAGFDVKFAVVNHVISVDDFLKVGCDTMKIADMFKDTAKAKLVEHYRLTPAQAEFVSYRGVNTARHASNEIVPALDTRWV